MIKIIFHYQKRILIIDSRFDLPQWRRSAVFIVKFDQVNAGWTGSKPTKRMQTRRRRMFETRSDI